MTSTRACALLLCIATGCAEVADDAALRMAVEQTRDRMGLPPAWHEPWDSVTVNEQGAVLPLDVCVAAALRNNRELRADLERIGEADADLLQAGLMSNPVISFMVMFPSGGGRTMLRGNALPMQPLQDLWLIPARKEVAAAELREAILRVSDRAVETAAKVKRAYVELQYVLRAIELINANIELVDQTINLLQVRQTAGQASQVDVNLARIRRDRLRSDVLDMTSRADTTQHELLMLMGCAEAAINWTVEPLGETEDESDPRLEETTLVLLASRQRLDLRAAEWTVEAAMRRVDLSRREGWPDMAVGFTFERAPRGRTRGASAVALAADSAAQGFVDGLNGTMRPQNVTQIAPLPRPTREVVYTLGPMFELELPIFDWGQAQTARARHTFRRAMAEYDARLQEVVKSVRSTLAEHEEARAQLQLYGETILPQVESNLQLAQQTYIAGQTDLTIYFQAQEELINTRMRMLEFLRNRQVSEVELERAVGGPSVWDEARLGPSPDATAAPVEQPTSMEMDS